MADLLLSEEEKYYLVIGVAQDKRVDGRSRLDFRSGDIEMNCVSNSHGSVRIQLAETDVIIAAKVDLGVPTDEAPDIGRIDFLVDCSPTASPEFEGRGGDELAETICRILTSAFVKSGTIDLKSLCIIPQKYCYVIGIDILVLQCGGNLLDIISMGVKVCLGICEIPKITDTRFDLGEPTPVFSTDEFSFIYLDVSQAPVVITLPRVGKYFVVDATLEEESCSKGKLAIGVSPNGTITSVDKLGRGCYQTRSIAASVLVRKQSFSFQNLLSRTPILYVKFKNIMRHLQKKLCDIMCGDLKAYIDLLMHINTFKGICLRIYEHLGRSFNESKLNLNHEFQKFSISDKETHRDIVKM